MISGSRGVHWQCMTVGLGAIVPVGVIKLLIPHSYSYEALVRWKDLGAWQRAVRTAESRQHSIHTIGLLHGTVRCW